jgi:hypothetical protein
LLFLQNCRFAKRASRRTNKSFACKAPGRRLRAVFRKPRKKLGGVAVCEIFRGVASRPNSVSD